VGPSTISAPFQRFFSGMREGRTVNAEPQNSSEATAANSPARRQAAGVTPAGAVAAVPHPERGSDEAEHHLGGVDHLEVGGTASAAPPNRRLRWLP
jgi:hypothetical protein